MSDISQYLGLLSAIFVAWLIGKNIGISSATKRLIDRQAKVNERESRLKNIGQIVQDLGADKATLPSLVRWSQEIQRERDDLDANLLLIKKRPAPAAAERLREANRKARDHQKIANDSGTGWIAKQRLERQQWLFCDPHCRGYGRSRGR